MQFTKFFATMLALAATGFAVAAPADDAAAVEGCVTIKNGLGCPKNRPVNCKDFANGDHRCCAHPGGC